MTATNKWLLISESRGDLNRCTPCRGKTRPTHHTLSTLSPCMVQDHTYLTWSTYSNPSRGVDKFGWITLLPRKRVPDIIHSMPADRSTDIPSYDQRFRSYEHCKLGEGGVLLEIRFRQIKLSGQVWTLSLLPKGIWKNSDHKDPREFYKLSNEG
jgi:hypothetical protein